MDLAKELEKQHKYTQMYLDIVNKHLEDEKKKDTGRYQGY